MTYEPSWDAGEWDEFWLDNDHEANEFESTPPKQDCRHSAIRVPVLSEWHGNREVWAWKCRICGEPMYEVPR